MVRNFLEVCLSSTQINLQITKSQKTNNKCFKLNYEQNVGQQQNERYIV